MESGGAKMVQTRLVRENFYCIEDERVRQFLITGKEESILIDTGFADSHVADAVKSVTDTPVKVLLTHADRDHIGGLSDFEEVYLNEKDWGLVSIPIRLRDLCEGDCFSCGGYRLEVVSIPGHTYGSVAFVDWENRLLLPGDSVQKEGPIYMFGPHRNLDLYIESLRKLLPIADKIDTILPCHHECPIDSGYIMKNLQDALALREGKLEGEKHPSLPCSTFRGIWTQFYR